MSEVLTQAQDGVLIITINRPEAKNAVNQAVAQGIAAAMEKLDNDKSLNAGIITGAGGTFCSGMDLKAFLRGELPSIKGKGFAGFIESPPAKPLIGAVEGYALAGGICGIAGLLIASRLNSAQPALGLGYELDAIAAVVIGGTSLAGGSGTIGGTVIGALIIGVLNNGMSLLGVSAFYQLIIKGFIIILAVWFDVLQKRK